MHDVAWRGMWICVRSKDAQKQLARTSLSFIPCHFIRSPSRLRAISVILVPDLALADCARVLKIQNGGHKTLNRCEGSLWRLRFFLAVFFRVKHDELRRTASSLYNHLFAVKPKVTDALQLQLYFMVGQLLNITY